MTRRHFLALGTTAAWAHTIHAPLRMLDTGTAMMEKKHFDAIIVGGSYAGLAAGLALGRSLRRVLIVDAGTPCNRQTPFSHNFITQDGVPPLLIAAKARAQVERYPTVEFQNGLVTDATRSNGGFQVCVNEHAVFTAKRLVFATGIRDLLPAIPGLAECWGISVLHCPYCHGYEVRDEATAVLGNGEKAFELTRMIANWTKELTLFTNGPSMLSPEQTEALRRHGIGIEQSPVRALEHQKGQVHIIHFTDGSARSLRALYAMPPFEQHCDLPQQLGCSFTDEGYIQVDPMQQTTVPGIYACGDGTSRFRTVANAVSTGTMAGMMLNKELIAAEF